MKRLLLLWGLLLSGLAWAANPAVAAGSLTVGVLFPMSGSNAPYGQNALRGVKLAMAARPQVLGRQVEISVVDNKSDKMEASNGANRLIQHNKVVAIIGPLSSSNSMAAGPVCESARVPMISPWATNPQVTQGKKYAFRVCFIDPVQGQVAAAYAYHTLKARTAAVMVDVAQGSSLTMVSIFEKAFAKLGGKTALRAMYSSGDQDFSGQLMAIKQANPDLIYLQSFYSESALIARQAREMGLKQPILSGDAVHADELIKIGGPAVEGLAFTTHFHERGVTTPAGKNFVKAYRDQYNEAPDACGALAYDAYNVLLDALARARTTEPAALVQALEQTREFPGVTGVMSLVDHDAVKPVVVLHVKDGKFVYLATVNP